MSNTPEKPADAGPRSSDQLSAGDLTLKQKQAANVWDHIDDVLPVIELARAGKWHWCENFECKYIELRIDMRDGGCLIKDRNGNRINPADLAKQTDGHMHGDAWPTERLPLGAWQIATAKAVDTDNVVADRHATRAAKRPCAVACPCRATC